MIATARELYDAGLSGFERDLGFFPVSVFFRSGRKRVFRELDTPHFGKTGIWYALEKSDSIHNDDEFSFLDTDENFYCALESPDLDAGDREKLGAFVTLFRDEITAVSDGRMDIVTLWDILHASRCRCPGGDFSFCTEEIHSGVVSLLPRALLTKAESGLPVNIVLDVLGGYRPLWNFATYEAKRIWYQKNTEDEFSFSDGFWTELDEDLASSGIRDGFYENELKIGRKERSEIRAFITNNALLLSCLSDTPDTGVDISFFRENFIPEGLLVRKSVRNALERKVRSRVMEYRRERHFRESYRYSLTYYRQKGSGDSYVLCI